MLENFDFNNLPKIVDLVFPLWGAPDSSDDFNLIDVGYIVRNNIYKAENSFQLRDSSGQFLSAVFLEEFSDNNQADLWMEEKSKNFSDYQKYQLNLVKEYLHYMDNKTLSLMQKDDIKLSLFVSTKKGSGKPLLDKVFEMLKNKGYKNIYLWTDSDCNYEWYFNHDYTLLNREIYKPFTRENRIFETFIFKKEL